MVRGDLEAWRRTSPHKSFRNFVGTNTDSRLGPYLGLGLLSR